MRQHHAVLVAQTRDLVQKLTALADRYEALPRSRQPPRARERAVNITLMRLAAASGSRFVDSAAPGAPEQSAPAPVQEEQADPRRSEAFEALLLDAQQREASMTRPPPGWCGS